MGTKTGEIRGGRTFFVCLIALAFLLGPIPLTKWDAEPAVAANTKKTVASRNSGSRHSAPVRQATYAKPKPKPTLPEPTVIDYQNKLSPAFNKVLRETTKYIIVHTSEGGLESTLRTVSMGKCRNGVICTTGGHANYVISRTGVIYRTLDHKYISHHAGISMWDGEYNLNKSSVGIEMVGYHYGEITGDQYRALSWLLKDLQGIYRIPDKNVLTHSQVAYSGPNFWFPKNHRGRKRCAKNFEPHRAGLTDAWQYDPDVKSGRLMPDTQLAAIFYGGSRQLAVAKTQTNVISKLNTAWSIAGEDYDAPDTMYELPNGKTVHGDQMEKVVGWNRVPAGTKVHLNVEQPQEVAQKGPIRVIGEGATAWSMAGKDFKKPTTKYLMPTGEIVSGDRLQDWDNIPPGTRMILGYRGPYSVDRKRYPLQIAGKAYNSGETLYYFSDYSIKNGTEIRDFGNLPEHTYMFVKVD